MEREMNNPSASMEQRLAALGITLPPAPAPAANYLPWTIAANQLWIAGQAPIRDGKYDYVGRVGEEIAPQDAYAAARLCAINVLAQVKAACKGDWSRMIKGVRVCGYIAAAPNFFEFPKVLDGCSDLLVEVLGEAGKHVRTVMGVSGLRFNVPIVVDAVFEIHA
jgi:enamine deaminase RidA (YjgF/YER057c/UK114 family)